MKMATAEEKVETALCSKCKMPVFTGVTGGMQFIADLTPVDPLSETNAFIAGRSSFEMNDPKSPAGLRVRYRLGKVIGTAVPPGHTVLLAHPCKTGTVQPPKSQVKAAQPRQYDINSVTGMPTEGLPMYPPDWDNTPPPFDGWRVIEPDGPPPPEPFCERCGTIVARGTGAAMFIPGLENWGVHDALFCKAAVDVDTEDDSMIPGSIAATYDLRDGGLIFRKVADVPGGIDGFPGDAI